MNTMTENTENVGEKFSADDLLEARRLAWKALDETAAEIKPGLTEKEALQILKASLQKNGSEKIWHPPQIRFGKNTTKSFGEKSDPDVVLGKDDLFFLDIGPVFLGHEGDVGRTYTVGDNPLHKRIAQDAKDVFEATRDAWAKTKMTGQDLYNFATSLASERGWELGLGGASGHRISDFPHAVHYRGKLRTQAHVPAQQRWILEIHLLDRDGRFGAFFEDLL